MDRKVLVFDDLTTGNFVHSDKCKGFDLDHLRLSLKWLAKWHASTAVLLQQVTLDMSHCHSFSCRLFSRNIYGNEWRTNQIVFSSSDQSSSNGRRN